MDLASANTRGSTSARNAGGAGSTAIRGSTAERAVLVIREETKMVLVEKVVGLLLAVTPVLLVAVGVAARLARWAWSVVPAPRAWGAG